MASTFKTIFGFRALDLTENLNKMQKDLVSKGIFNGGEVSPVPGELKVSVSPFSAMGANGMITILTGDPVELEVNAGQTQRVVGRFTYVSNDAAQTDLEVLTETEFDNDADKDELITFARLTLSLSATEVTNGDIDKTYSDEVDPQVRSPFRGSVDSVNDLPSESSSDVKKLREGDLYFVRGTSQFHYWDASNLEWNRVVDEDLKTAFEEHANNEDPSARHISKGASDALSNPASGEALSEDNAVVDESYTLLALAAEKFDVTGAYQVQLDGKYFVGNGSIDTAKLYFVASRATESGDSDFVFRQQQQLVGSDNEGITVLGIYAKGAPVPSSAPTPSSPGSGTLINPSADADSYGYIEDPVVRFNFEFTNDDGYTGKLAIHTGKIVDVGDVSPEDLIKPLAFYPNAELVSAATTSYDVISSSNDTVQKQLRALDAAINQEIIDRQNAIDDLLAGDNTWTGDNTYEGEQIFKNIISELGTSILETISDAYTPRISSDLKTGETTSGYIPTNLWTAFGADKKFRLYVKGDGTLLITVNAERSGDGTQVGAVYSKDITGERAALLELSNSAFHFFVEDASTDSWSAENWTEEHIKIEDLNSLVSIAKQLSLGTNLGVANPRADFPLLPESTEPRTLIFEFEGNSDLDDPVKTRAYLKLEPEGGASGAPEGARFEITTNAVWRPGTSDWAKDADDQHSLKFSIGYTGFKNEQKLLHATTWTDSEWSTDTGNGVPGLFSLYHTSSGFNEGRTFMDVHDFRISDKNPSTYASDFGFSNTLMAKNFPKAWLYAVTDGSSGFASVDAFNIDTNNITLGTTNTFPFADGMADSNYCVLATPGGSYNAYGVTKSRVFGSQTSGEFDIAFYNENGDTVDTDNTSGIIINILVFGNQ